MKQLTSDDKKGLGIIGGLLLIGAGLYPLIGWKVTAIIAGVIIISAICA